VEAHQLRHAAGGSGRGGDARTVEVDDQRLDPGARVAEQQVADVEIRVPPAGIVERANRSARSRGRALAHGRVEPVREQRAAVARVLLVDGRHHGAVEAANALRRDPHRGRDGCAGRAQPRQRLQLGERAREPEQTVALKAAQEPAPLHRTQVQPLASPGQRYDGGARAPARATRPGQDALEFTRREQAERERSALELGGDVENAVAVALLAEVERLRTRCEGAGRPHGGVDYPPPSRRARLAITACLNPLEASPPADRILVIRLGAVGDVVRTLPAVSSLRAAYAGAHLAWLVEPAAITAVEGQPWVDEVIVFPRDRLEAALRRPAPVAALRELRAFLRALRSRRFDLVVDFHGILRSAVLGALTGARRRISYARPFGRELAWCLATDRAQLPPVRVSRFERNAELVRFLAVAAPPAPAPMRVDPAKLARVAASLGPGGAPVVIHPGTSDATPYKRYPAEGYGQVARALASQDGLRCIVSAGPARADRALAEAVVAASQGAARLAPATPTLADLALLFAASRLYIGSDSGPMHVASLVGTPVVQLLGPTDPIENEPWSETPSRQVRFPVPCSPCRRGCAAATCMRGIPPEAVLSAARELLAPSERAALRFAQRRA